MAVAPDYPSSHNLGGAREWETVTPSDTLNFTKVPRAIGVTAAGNVVCVDAGGNTWTVAFAAGEIKPISPVRINNTSTTATGIKALY